MQDHLHRFHRFVPVLGAVALTVLGAVALAAPAFAAPQETAPGPSAEPTAEEAAGFVDLAESTLYELGVAAGRAAWVQANFITYDTQILAAESFAKVISAAARFASEATRYDGLELPYDVERRLERLKLGITLPAPSNVEDASALTRLTTSLESTYGAGEYCAEDGTCRDLGELSEVIAESRDPAALLDAWTGWRTVSVPMRADYQSFVELSNAGARELGFADVGALWRSGYDMDPDAFAAELDRLWGQVRPLYEQLHCYVRAELADHYGTDVVDPQGTIPAHLTGNMWAQSWANIYDLVGPEGMDAGYDLTEILEREEFDALRMVETGERFFTSLGFEPLPDTFWERSLFTQPEDRDVVCHASAWDVDEVDDLRIKMCIKVDAEDFNTIHHELGHNFYQRAYNAQPYLYRNSANDGFHEAVGDTIALSVTPEYLKEIGLLETVPDASADIGLLLRSALDKVAFLPFGLLIDQWRWQVFSGEIGPDEYNAGWWRLREQYQGVSAPVARTEEQFDPGAKYHVPGNTPYTRYFLAHILQYQFHRSLCATAGYEGPLHRCSIYGNQEAGAKLAAMLEMGASRPWPDALEALTGQREMDATAVIDYYAPLMTWLEDKNQGRQCGW
jgi:peptidyl-dipeptidase A